jgi:hypothetical protein
MEPVAKFYRLFIFDNHKIPKKIRNKKLFTFYHPEVNRISEDKISINIMYEAKSKLPKGFLYASYILTEFKATEFRLEERKYPERRTWYFDNWFNRKSLA